MRYVIVVMWEILCLMLFANTLHIYILPQADTNIIIYEILVFFSLFLIKIIFRKFNICAEMFCLPLCRILKSKRSLLKEKRARSTVKQDRNASLLWLNTIRVLKMNFPNICIYFIHIFTSTCKSRLVGLSKSYTDSTHFDFKTQLSVVGYFYQ